MSSPHGSVVRERWAWTAPDDTSTLVLPDGCRDVIVSVPASGAPRVWVSPRDDTARAVHAVRGDHFAGYRLHPAAAFDERALCAIAWSEVADDGARAALDAHVRVDEELSAALDALARADSVAAARRVVGVTERTLERWICARTERTPSWWQGLARVRRAAASLNDPLPLATLATRHGYADQSHMSRAFQRWFQISPGRMRRRPDLLAVLREAAYDIGLG
jgi:AraC-like DNA-binding protein